MRGDGNDVDDDDDEIIEFSNPGSMGRYRHMIFSSFLASHFCFSVLFLSCEKQCKFLFPATHLLSLHHFHSYISWFDIVCSSSPFRPFSHHILSQSNQLLLYYAAQVKAEVAWLWREVCLLKEEIRWFQHMIFSAHCPPKGTPRIKIKERKEDDI